MTTTSLDVTDDETRAIVQRWLAENTEQLGTPLRLTYEQAVPVTAAPGDAFQNLLHERATVSQIQYNDVRDVRRFGLDVKAGWELGFMVELEERTSRARIAEFLSAVRPDGRRVLLGDGTCR